ncbi:MAG: type II secretion system F family protein, partial [Endomicrobiia bacterium]
MPQFNYKARGITGNITQGVIEASDIRSATERLRAQRLIVLEIIEAKKKGFLQTLLKPKVKTKDLCIFSRQLATLVTSGIPIVQGLGILQEQMTNPAFKEIVSKVKEDIESGISIADAMKKHPSAFSELYVSMVHAGEIGGILDVILDRLSSYLEAAEELKGKIKGAMTYPIVVALIAVGAATFMLTGVIPQFAGIFREIGVELPVPTKIMLALSDFVKSNILFLIIVPVGGFIGFKQALNRIPAFRYKFDAFKLKLPVFGDMIRKMSIAKFTRTFGTLVRSGVPIIQSLETVAKTSGNKVIEKAINEAKESIKEGERIAEPLKKSNVFPPMVIQMISVGEETGSLDTMLIKISDFYDREVDESVKAL